jgi:hypothetical protein
VQQPVIQLGTAIDGDIFPGGALNCGEKIKPCAHFFAISSIKTVDISKGILAGHAALALVAAVTSGAVHRVFTVAGKGYLS